MYELVSANLLLLIMKSGSNLFIMETHGFVSDCWKIIGIFWTDFKLCSRIFNSIVFFHYTNGWESPVDIQLLVIVAQSTNLKRIAKKTI